jgi:hypothetical protein
MWTLFAVSTMDQECHIISLTEESRVPWIGTEDSRFKHNDMNQCSE